MPEAPAPSPTRGLAIPNAPVLVAGLTHAAWLEPTGEILLLAHGEAAARVRARRRCSAMLPAAARRLGIDPFPALDLLELFAFVRPATLLPADAARPGDALDLAPPRARAEAERAAGRSGGAGG